MFRIVVLLLGAGAQPLIRNNDGKTPRDIAADRGHLQVVELLERVTPVRGDD